MLVSEGKLVYFNNWAILECDPELQEYYKWWVFKAYGVRIQGSKFGSHISVIRGDVEQINPELKENLWRHHAGKLVDFRYENNIVHNGEHFWVNAYSDFLEEMRMEMGLPPQPPFKLHFTVGRLKPEDLCIFKKL